MTQTTYTFDENCFSDLHKDAYGYRPFFRYFEWLKSATDDEKQAKWDRMLVVLDASIKREEEMQQECIKAFEKSVADALSVGAKDRKQAVDWLMQGDPTLAGQKDYEFFEFNNGIPYGYLKKTNSF